MDLGFNKIRELLGGDKPLPYEKTPCCRGDPCGLPVKQDGMAFS